MSEVPEAGRGGASIEREAKYRLTAAQAAALHARLEREARFLRDETQITTVFRDRAAFLADGAYLRLRSTGARTELTLKGPKTGSGLAAWRTEHSVTVGPGPILEMLATIGFAVRTRYVKRTRVYAYQEVLVFVDFVEGLGWFCEIETDDLERDLVGIRDSLGLRDEDLESRGYPALAEALG